MRGYAKTTIKNSQAALRLVGTILASLGTALSTAFQPSLGEADSADLDADLGGDNAAHFVCPRGHIHRPHSKPFHMAPMGSIPRLFRACQQAETSRTFGVGPVV
jgi:hypothetical protein